jgi:hypothetical protein
LDSNQPEGQVMSYRVQRLPGGIGGRRQYNEERQHDVVLQALLKQFGSGELHRLMAEGERLGDEQAARMALGDR